jgi:hypothetical protein
MLLAGRDYGIKIFNEQVKDKIDYNDSEIIVIFPDNIQSMASSFIQGFFLDFVEHIGIIGIEEKVRIENNGTNFKQMIIDNLI